MKNIEKFETEFEFGGFYNSIHDGVIDDFIDTYWRNRETDELPINFNELYNKVKFKSLQKFYVEELIKHINYELKTNLEYVELNSPAYYNFTTDTITVKFEQKDFDIVYNYLEDEFAIQYSHIDEYLKDWTTRVDGFIPFNNYSDIKDNPEWKMRALLRVFADYCFNYETEFWDGWYATIDDNLYGVSDIYGLDDIEPIYENLESYLNNEIEILGIIR